MKQVNNKVGKSLKTLDSFINEQYGDRGTQKRETFERDYETFKIGVLIQEARLKKGITQEELAVRIGTSKGYISKIENNLRDIRISTLQKIIGALDGHLNLSITV